VVNVSGAETVPANVPGAFAMTVTASSMASLASSCVGHCFTIIDLLEKAEGNDKEHTSLLVAVRSIHGFLVDLPAEGITQQGNNVLSGSPGGPFCK